MTNKKNNGYLILTAAAFVNPKIKDYIYSKITQLEKKRIAIITTASTGKENNKYCILAKEIYQSMGVDDVKFIDMESDANFDFSQMDVIHICGGNTFKLIYFARLAKLDQSIRSLIGRGGVCIGVSAGSLILGPSIKIASEVRPDINEISEEDFTGLRLTKYIVFPHYEELNEPEIVSFETRNGVTVERVRNSQAISIHNDESIWIQ